MIKPSVCVPSCVVLLLSVVLWGTFGSTVQAHDHQGRAENSSVKVICYYSCAGAPFNGTLPPDLNVTLCTHIIMFGVGINDSQVYVDPTFGHNCFSVIPLMKKLNPSLKVFGCSTGNFSQVLATETNTTRFIKSAAPLLRKYRFDGFDLDWEFPAFQPDWYLPGQKPNFTKVIQGLWAEFHQEAQATGKPRLSLTVAVAAVFLVMDMSYEIDKIAPCVDWVNLMTYDFHAFTHAFPFTGHNSPLYPSKSILDKTIFEEFYLVWAANEWVRRGMNKTQVMVGLPVYGHTYKLLDSAFHALYDPAEGPYQVDEVPYSMICKVVQDPASQVVWDNDSFVPYVYRDNLWISFDNEQSLVLKTKWILQENFGGVMIFSLNNDDFAGVCDGKTKFPLISAVYRTVQSNSYSHNDSYPSPSHRSRPILQHRNMKKSASYSEIHEKWKFILKVGNQV